MYSLHNRVTTKDAFHNSYDSAEWNVTLLDISADYFLIVFCFWISGS